MLMGGDVGSYRGCSSLQEKEDFCVDDSGCVVARWVEPISQLYTGFLYVWHTRVHTHVYTHCV